MTSLVDIQREDLYEIVDRRNEISLELRHLLTEDTVDTDQVMSLIERYGVLDGEISYYYATHFVEVAWSLTSTQFEELMLIRDLDEYPCTGAYLYSENIDMPEIIDTDFLFGFGDNPTTGGGGSGGGCFIRTSADSI